MKNHVFYYSILISVLFLGFWASWQVRWVFVLLPIFYAILTISHHAVEHTLTTKIVVEYTLIAGIGMAIMSLLLIGGL